jgi:hypothetical protein
VNLEDFLMSVRKGETFDFKQTIEVIFRYYLYQPTEFVNGIEQPLINLAGENEGACKIFAFAMLHKLSEQETLGLFGDFYRLDVLGNPGGDNHPNIRQFMRSGWEGIRYSGVALKAK